MQCYTQWSLKISRKTNIILQLQLNFFSYIPSHITKPTCKCTGRQNKTANNIKKEKNIFLYTYIPLSLSTHVYN